MLNSTTTTAKPTHRLTEAPLTLADSPARPWTLVPCACGFVAF